MIACRASTVSGERVKMSSARAVGVVIGVVAEVLNMLCMLERRFDKVAQKMEHVF